MTFWGNIVYLRPRSVICGPSPKREGRKWQYTRAQINNILEKSRVIIINKQGQMISRMRGLIIQAKWITNSKSLQIIMEVLIEQAIKESIQSSELI